jgi:hypothetical protein
VNLNVWARGALAAAVAATAMGATTAGASAVPAPPAVQPAAVQPVPAQPVTAAARSVLLVNGDRLTVRTLPEGRSEISVLSAASDHDGLVSLRRGGDTEMIPEDALPYLGRGLDASLFDIPLLLRAEVGGRLPVRVRFSGRRPALPGMTVTGSGPGTARGYLTSSTAGEFGMALERQFRSDHARGAYGASGLFAGGVTVTLAGAHARPARSDVATHTLTVTGSDLSGKPDNGDVAWVFDADNMAGYSNNTGIFSRGVAKFSVPAGRYWVIGEFDTTSPGGGVTRLDFLPQVSVAQDTTVHTAASAATSEVTMATPRPAALVDVTFTANLTGPHGSTDSIDWYNAPGQIWVSPTRRKPAVGTLQAFATEQLASATSAAGTPYAYNLNYADPAGIIPPQHYLASPSNLATVTETYFQDVPSAGAWITRGWLPGEQILGWYLAPLALPSRQIQYFSTAPSLLWSAGYGASVPTGGGFPSGGQEDTYRHLSAGEHLVMDWDQYPLHPQPDFIAGVGHLPFPFIPAATRAGNTLTLTTFPFSDNVPGHLSAGSVTGTKVTESYRVDQNGAQIAAGNAYGGIPPVTVSAKPSVIRFTLNAARSGPAYVLSPRTQTVWTWRSRPQPTATVPQAWYCAYVLVGGQYQARRRCAVQPMMTLDYQVRRLALDGTAPAGLQLIDLTVGHLQLAPAARVTGAAAQVSCDDGQRWQRATVTASGDGRFRAGFRVPGGCAVTLRVSATDAAGGSVTETITRAYAVAS